MPESWCQGSTSRYFVQPPPQLYSATYQLALVAEAVEARDADAVRAALLAVDIQPCQRHWLDCTREGSRRHRKEVHGARDHPKPKVSVNATTRREIGERDGWRCRYCALPVTAPELFKSLFALDLPDVGDAANDVWRVFCQSPDHVVPVAADGENTTANLVTACGSCNYAKSGCWIEELGLEDPRARDPIRDGWTGLVGRPRRAS